jgi:benzil reductase ((S)-benzoin forming)
MGNPQPMNLYIVTGTTKGLGKALAERIAGDAANELIALARAPDGPIEGGTGYRLDLDDVAAIEHVFDRVEAHVKAKRFAKAVLINNAGVIAPVGPIDRVPGQEIARAITVNLVAPLLLMRRFLLATAGIPVRRVINISSGAGRRPIAGWGPYCAAKSGLDMASRVAAQEMAGKGVDIVSLAPGVIDTDMQGTVRGASKDDFPDVARFREMKTGGELRDAKDVAAEILRHERAGKLTGEALLDLRTLA